MKAKLIGYWAATGLTSLAFVGGGVSDLARSPDMTAAMGHLGYPAYFLLILGAWKLLGAIAIAVPGIARVKEWAYAGIAFDLTGAAVSHAMSGDDAGKVVTPLVILAVAMTSWALRPESRILGRLGAPRDARKSGSPVTASA